MMQKVNKLLDNLKAEFHLSKGKSRDTLTLHNRYDTIAPTY
jgi:hypothetical protein